MVRLIVAAVVVIGLGTYAIIAMTGTDPAVAAADLADQFLARSNLNDGQGVASLFVEDGTLVMVGPSTQGTGSVGRELQGRAQIAADVNFWAPNVADWRRVGDVIATDSDSFTFSATGDYLGRPHNGSGELKIQGDLISHLTWNGVTPAD